MGVLLTMTPPTMEPGETHISTTWEFSRDGNFLTLDAQASEDTINLYSKNFNIELLPGVKYYARARYISNWGLSKWTNIAEFITLDVHNPQINLHRPSQIPAPEISFQFDNLSVPYIFFRANATPYHGTRDNAIIATTWIVEDLNGDVVFFRNRDPENITSIIIDVQLAKNETYVLKASYHAASGDVSEFGSSTFYISNDENYYIKKLVKINDNSIGLVLRNPQDFSSGELEIYNDIGVLVKQDTLTIDSIDYDDVDTTDTVYLLARARCTYTDGHIGEWSYYLANLSDILSGLPQPLPYALP